MEDKLKVNASVFSIANEISKDNSENFYMNGRFMFEHEAKSVQVSLEDTAKEFLFAVSDGMDKLVLEKGIVVSTVRELQKFHSRIKPSGKGINVKLEQLCEIVEEVNNLLLSISLGDNVEEKEERSFAGLFISGTKAAVIGSGTARLFMLREESLTRLVSEDEKTDRLLKMGIITDKQAEELSRQFGNGSEKKVGSLRKSEIFDIRTGDTILLCTDGVPENIDDETLYEYLSKRNDSNYAAYSLLNEALNAGTDDNVTVMVVKIKDENEVEDTIPTESSGRIYHKKYVKKQKEPEVRSVNAWRIASVFALLILIPVVVFWSFKLLFSKTDEIPVGSTNNETVTTQITHEDQTVTPDTDPSSESPDGEVEPVDTEEEARYYVVQSGDSLYSITMKFYGDAQKSGLITRANNIADPNLLYVGQKLEIPNVEQ